MKDKLEPNMYVRTEKGKIDKIIGFDGALILFLYDLAYGYIDDNDIIKASHNIIDLIEIGDYVNGYKVSFKGNDYQPFVQCDYPVENGTTNHYKFYEQAIKSIVTKESMESVTYYVK